MTYIRDIDNDLTYDSASNTYVLTSTIVEPEVPESTNSVIQELAIQDTVYDIHSKAIQNKNSLLNNPVYTWVGTLSDYQTQNIKTEHPDWICNITDLASNNINVYDKEEVDLIINNLKEYPKQYWLSGVIANSTNTFQGYGQATIVLYSSGLAQIDYEYIVTTAGTNDSLFNWGLNRDLFQALNSNIPIITPSTGGHCYIYTDGGVLWSSEMVNITESASNFWCISQIDDTSNNTISKYSESTLSLDYRVSGTAYGTFTV